MTAEEVRRHLADDYNYDVEAMAKDHRLDVHTVTLLLQKGGGALREGKTPSGTEASYDVAFAPMINVKLRVADPLNPTGEEQIEILALAKDAIADAFNEKLGPENASIIRLYSVDGKKVPNHYVLGLPETDGIDPEILFELTINTANKLDEAYNDHSAVWSYIRYEALRLTEKYKNTDWREKDFWLTMEEESDAFLRKHGIGEDATD